MAAVTRAVASTGDSEPADCALPGAPTRATRAIAHGTSAKRRRRPGAARGPSPADAGPAATTFRGSRVEVGAGVGLVDSAEVVAAGRAHGRVPCFRVRVHQRRCVARFIGEAQGMTHFVGGYVR